MRLAKGGGSVFSPRIFVFGRRLTSACQKRCVLYHDSLTGYPMRIFFGVYHPSKNGGWVLGKIFRVSVRAGYLMGTHAKQGRGCGKHFLWVGDIHTNRSITAPDAKTNETGNATGNQLPCTFTTYPNAQRFLRGGGQGHGRREQPRYRTHFVSSEKTAAPSKAHPQPYLFELATTCEMLAHLLASFCPPLCPPPCPPPSRRKSV